jgi:hypothetical protein
MTQNAQHVTTFELLRACPAIPLATDGSEMPPAEMPPGMEVSLEGERMGRLIVSARGSSPSQAYRYIVGRDDLARAVREPSLLPREGQAPTSSSNTAGAPD